MSVSNVARGMAIGAVEVIPGVSGGTIALVVGVYEKLIAAAGHLVSALRGVPDGLRRQGFARSRAALAQVDWKLVLAVGVGMVAAVLIAAQLLPPIIEGHPVGTRALFFGMVAATLTVPFLALGGRRRPVEWALFAVVAVLTALLTGLPPADLSDPPWWLVLPAAAAAVCALVLPGLSGSFLLLVVGLYEPTLQAVADRDLAYLGVFLLGAVIGLGAFVKVLQYLLDRHRRLVMAAMAGLLLGALRALWPWQTEDRGLLLPDAAWWAMVPLALVGAIAVAALAVYQHRRDGGSTDGSSTDGSATDSSSADGSEAPTAPIRVVRRP
jgi:putative membrane protein